MKSFTLYVDNQEVYAKEIADALEADLQPSPLAASSREYPSTIPIPPTILSHRSGASHLREQACALLALLGVGVIAESWSAYR